MEPVLTPDEMRGADEATIARGVPGRVLMDRAAHACAVSALRRLGGGYGKRVVVVCGTGNNGGDGIAAARHLAAAGVRSTVFLCGNPDGDSAWHLERTLGTTPDVVRVEGWSRASFARAAARADLALDAVFGTGFTGEPRGTPAEALSALAEGGVRVLAIDIPSGVSGVDGSVPGVAVRADWTVAIEALKCGHVLAPGAFRCGSVEVARIGIEPEDTRLHLPEPADVRTVIPARPPDTHKYRAGVVAVLAGSPGMTGAAVLTATGALRAGAGLVLLGVPRSSLEVIETRVVEAVKVPLADIEGRLEAKAVDELSDRLDRSDAVAVGPGIGRGPEAIELIERALAIPRPLVVDADGLWALGEILSRSPDILTRGRDAPTILTPHLGEFAHLLGTQPPPNRLEAVREAALRWQAVVHLKGSRALTVAPDGRAWVNPTGNAGMATGGTGDVLTGVIGTLCAHGLEAEEATWAGAFLHGLAGDVAAARLGVEAMIAGDLVTFLPEAYRRVTSFVEPWHGRLRTVLEQP